MLIRTDNADQESEEASGGMASSGGSGQTAAESARPTIPQYRGKAPHKLVPFDIEKLSRSNAKVWKGTYRTFLELQGCWEVIDLTYKWRNDLDTLERLFQMEGWKAADAAARLYMQRGLK